MVGIVPTVGRIVLYCLSDADELSVYRYRESQGSGNRAAAGNIYPALVVAVWGNTPDCAVNLKVFLDGTSDLWVTSTNVEVAHDEGGVAVHTGGKYHWMDYQKKVAAGDITPNLHALPKV